MDPTYFVLSIAVLALSLVLILVFAAAVLRWNSKRRAHRTPAVRPSGDY